MLKFFRSALLGLSTLLLVGMLSSSALAANYGDDGYGACAYSNGCPQHTIITTPAGLEIAVNLVDGQQVAASGYDIVITPLNGSGTSFSRADIYINGQPVASVVPDETGTATWHWDPQLYPGTVVKVVATDQDGKTVSKQFTVVVTSQSQQPGNPSHGGQTEPTPSGKAGGIFHPIFKLASSFVKSAQTIIRQLPKPVVVAFPYLLFVVLMVEISVLLLQTNRELHELRTLRRLLAQEREVSELKQGFLQLVSHYLRTPLTILKSGAEGLLADGVRTNVVADIQQTATKLSATIEDIIARVDNAQANGVVVNTPAALSKHQARQKIVVWLPVAFVGVFAGLFVYFANTATEFDASVISIIIQVVIYTILASVVYQVWRRLHLHRRDGQDARAVLAEAAAVQASRDQVIQTAAENLKGYITSLETSMQQVSPTAINAKFVNKGLSQLKIVQNEFVIATRLQGARSTAPYAPTTLSAVYEDASATIANTAKDKGVTLSLTNDANYNTQSSGLLTLVLQTLLDNAVAYTSTGGKVEVSGNSDNVNSSIVVADNGQGIPTDKLNSLFQPFSKAEGAEVFTHEGMGFSLYLNKLIMMYLGGTIGIESAEGKGTQVTLSFAATAPSKQSK
jgi:signal transduction histidine kinase